MKDKKIHIVKSGENSIEVSEGAFELISQFQNEDQRLLKLHTETVSDAIGFLCINVENFEMEDIPELNELLSRLSVLRKDLKCMAN